MKTLVLGGGLIGLYAAHKLGAQLVTLKEESAIPYVFLHNAPENKAMLEDLGIPYDIGTWRIGFIHRGQVYRRATPEMVLEYHMKCYGVPPPKDKPQFVSSTYSILTPNYYDVRKKLASLVTDVVYGKVIELDLLKKEVLLMDGTTLKYDKLVNTLPLPDFMRMAGLEFPYEAKPLFYYKFSIWDTAFADFDTVHIMDGDDTRTRFVKGTVEPNSYFVETLTSDHTSYGEQPAMVVKYGKIMNGGWRTELRNNALAKLEEHGVFPISRFARWRAHYDTEDALHDLAIYTETRKL